MNWIMIGLSLFLSTLSSQAAIFGIDDRLAIDKGSSLSNLTQAVAVSVTSGLESEGAGNKLDLLTDSLEGFLCKSERLSSGPYLSYACTGFLVAPDLLVTAGHCATNSSIEAKNEKGGYCDVYSWLFDFQNEAGAPPRTTGIDKDRLYRCKEIVFAALDEGSPFRDFALIRLDRPVLGRTPLKLANSQEKVRGPLSMLGHPLGSSLKLSRNAKVLLDNPDRTSFITNLDAFEGNSGSPVFNARKEVVGLLIGGTPSMSLLREGSCERYNSCSESGKNCLYPDPEPSTLPGFQATGSEVQRIAPILELLKANSPE